MRIIVLAAIAALAFAGTADAKQCKDAKGKFIKCPPAAAVTTPAATPAATTTTTTSTPPKCVKGKVCGKTCIAVDKVCHKP
jgi:hypothetical protein